MSREQFDRSGFARVVRSSGVSDVARRVSGMGVGKCPLVGRSF